MPLLKDKVAVITGASSGIGRNTALLFGKEGARLVIGDIREDPREGGKPTHQEIIDHGGEAVFQKTDVTNLDNLKTLMDKAVNTYKSLDILVNSAGIFMMKPITEVTEEEYDRLMTINVKGTYLQRGLQRRSCRRTRPRVRSLTCPASPDSTALAKCLPTAPPKGR